ncbi:MAG: hypothetical protein ACYCZW_02370 [Minisyncoccota bacterium]
MEDEMRVILWLSVTCFLAFGQTKVTIDTEGYTPTVKVEDSAIKTMCQAFSKKLGTKAERISFRPKPVFPSRISDAGKVWVIDGLTERVETTLKFDGQSPTETSSSVKNRWLEFPNSELAPILQKIVGPVAQNVRLATCYTVDNYFSNTETVVIVPTDRKDAEQLVSALR